MFSGNAALRSFTLRYVVLKTFRRKTHQLLLFLFWGSVDVAVGVAADVLVFVVDFCVAFFVGFLLLLFLALALALLAFTWRKANWDSFNGQLRDCEAATALRNFPFPPRKYANYGKHGEPEIA